MQSRGTQPSFQQMEEGQYMIMIFMHIIDEIDTWETEEE